jgi:hypothetical protein
MEQDHLGPPSIAADVPKDTLDALPVWNGVAVAV